MIHGTRPSGRHHATPPGHDRHQHYQFGPHRSPAQQPAGCRAAAPPAHHQPGAAHRAQHPDHVPVSAWGQADPAGAHGSALELGELSRQRVQPAPSELAFELACRPLVVPHGHMPRTTRSTAAGTQLVCQLGARRGHSSPQCDRAVRHPIALPLLLVTASLDRIEHRPGARSLTLLFLVLVLFRLLGLAAALVLARHHCLHSFRSSVGACGAPSAPRSGASYKPTCSPCSNPDQIATVAKQVRRVVDGIDGESATSGRLGTFVGSRFLALDRAKANSSPGHGARPDQLARGIDYSGYLGAIGVATMAAGTRTPSLWRAAHWRAPMREAPAGGKDARRDGGLVLAGHGDGERLSTVRADPTCGELRVAGGRRYGRFGATVLAACW
jgi:hypothetical protein